MSGRRRHVVRETIAAMCELRESQSALERCVGRADRSFDDNVRERRALERQCAILRGKLDALERPARNAAKLRAVARAAAPLVYDPSLKRGVDGVAEVFPGWYASVARVRSLADAKRCLATLDARSAKWRAMQLKAVPKLAVPPCVSASERLLPLQNLPAWQSARVTLLACVIANSKKPTPARVRQLAQSLGVHEKYVGPLQSLVAR